MRCSRVKESTVKHYVDALIYKIFAAKREISSCIYEIADIGQMGIIRTYLQNDIEFCELDKRGHQMYSAGLNNYYKLALGVGLKMFGERLGY